MTSAQAAVAPKRPTRPFRPFAQPAPEPDDIVSCFTGQNGLELVVEMAHDIRSPLTSILFLVEALHQGQAGPVTESQRRSLGLIYSAALGLCTSASDVVELARGSHRLADPEPSPFSVSEVFTSVRNMILPVAREQGLDVRLVHPVPERRIGHARPLSRDLPQAGAGDGNRAGRRDQLRGHALLVRPRVAARRVTPLTARVLEASHPT